MKKSIKALTALALAVIMVFSLIASVFAVSEQTTTIPVTLTVIKTVKSIDVTMPVSMPISVLNEKVLTADNVQITNNSQTMAVEVVSVAVNNGAFTIEDYSAFPKEKTGVIAMKINGCETKAAGELAITKTAFPAIAPGTSLPIQYTAKVGADNEVKRMNVATVVFTLKAQE